MAEEALTPLGCPWSEKQLLEVSQLLRQGMALAQAIQDRGMDMAPGDEDALRDRLIEFGGPEVEAALMDPGRALGRLRKILRLGDEKDYLSILLWAAQAHIVALLESVFYLGFKGPTGSGKGTAVESCTLLTPNGMTVGSITDAALAAALDEGKALGIEEADVVLEASAKGLLPSLLRDGYRRGVTKSLMVPDEAGKKWVQANKSLFGPKCFDYHSSLEPHLLGRTVVLDMTPDDSVDRAMDAEKKARHLEPVRLWLARKAERSQKHWNRERVDALWDDPTFRKRVEAMKGKGGRDHIIAATMLLTCEIMGWDFEAMVKAIMAVRKTTDELGEEAEVAQTIIAIVGGRTGGEKEEISTDDLLKAINNRRAELHIQFLTPKRLGALLKDLGFSKARSKADGGATYYRAKKDPNRDKMVIRPGPILPLLAQAAQLAHESEAEGQDGQRGPDDVGGDGEGYPAGQVDAMVLDFIKTYDQGYGVPPSVLTRKDKGLGSKLTVEAIEQSLARQVEAGRLRVEAHGLATFYRGGSSP